MLNLSENIAKSFRGLLFLTHTVYITDNGRTGYFLLISITLPLTQGLPSLSCKTVHQNVWWGSCRVGEGPKRLVGGMPRTGYGPV